MGPGISDEGGDAFRVSSDKGTVMGACLPSLSLGSAEALCEEGSGVAVVGCKGGGGVVTTRFDGVECEREFESG